MENKKSFWQATAALVLALLVILALERLTNRLDQVEGHAWDFVYYIDMAENGILGNDQLGSPYAYRFLTPLFARVLNQIFDRPTLFGFRVAAYLGLWGTLFGLYLIARHLKARFWTAVVAMFVPATALFNFKFILFDYYRPDQFAYLLLVFALLALLKGRLVWCILLSLIGLQTREFSIIPPLIVLYETFQAWRNDCTNLRLVARAGGVMLAVGMAFALPRALIPVTFTQQILDPFNDPNFLRVLLGMPFDLRRDFNFLYNLLAYFLPLLIIATPQRLKTAWQTLGRLRAWIVIYMVVVLVAMTYGGTDMMRYATYFFIPQFLVLVFMFKRDVHIYEVLYMFGALILFNRLMYLMPIWDFSLYRDLYAGYGDVINIKSYLRLGEVFAFLALGQVVRSVIHEREEWQGMTLAKL